MLKLLQANLKDNLYVTELNWEHDSLCKLSLSNQGGAWFFEWMSIKAQLQLDLGLTGQVWIYLGGML